MRFLWRRWHARFLALRTKPTAELDAVPDDEWAEAIVPIDLSPRQRERFEAAAARALAQRRSACPPDENGSIHHVGERASTDRSSDG